MNGRFGSKYHIRVVILVYDNKPMSTFEKQRSYWQGGNKNELVIGFGVKDGLVTWANVFTWSEADNFVVNTKSEASKQISKPINIDKLTVWLESNIPNGWKRKHFSDFEYLKVEYPTWYNILIIIMCSVISVGIAAFNVMNDIHSTDFDDETPRFIIELKQKMRNTYSNVIRSIKKYI